jgi:hypothetical protein
MERGYEDVDCIQLTQDKVEQGNSYEHNNKTFCILKGQKFLDYLTDYLPSKSVQLHAAR